MIRSRCRLFALPVILLAGLGGGLVAAGDQPLAQVSAPSFSPAPGVYFENIEVSLSCATPEAVIHYTTDGSAPTTASPVYDGTPILVDHHASVNHDPDPSPDDPTKPLSLVSAAIRAIAVKTGWTDSDIAVGDYVVDKIVTHFNIPYDTPPAAGGAKHLLDIYHPREARNNKVLLFIHGGAWMQGDKNMYLELGNTFAGYYGLTTVIANYELSDSPWWAVFPDHIEDVAKAFAWVVEHIAEYGGDPRKIFLFGQSAGGHLVSLLSTQEEYLSAPYGLSLRNIKGVVSMSGIYAVNDMVKWPNNPLNLTLGQVQEYQLLCSLVFNTQSEAQLALYSPGRWISPAQPPFHTIYCWNDMPGFPEEAVDFFARVTALNGPYIDLFKLEAADIPPEVLALDFGVPYNGHYQEIYAINTLNWDDLSTRTVVDFLNLPMHYAYDVNEDGILNETDAQALAAYLTEQGTLPHGDSSADVNLDSRADILDLVILDLQLTRNREGDSQPLGTREPALAEW